MTRISRSKHRKALEMLSQHSDIIGIDKKSVLTSSVEPKLFKRGAFYCQPDLVYEINSKDERRIIVIEYKSNGDSKLCAKGESQLAKSVHFYKDILKVKAEGRLILGDTYPELTKGINNIKQSSNNYNNTPEKLR